MTRISTDIDAMSLIGRLRELEDIYPGFSDWYCGKVIPGLAGGSRSVIVEMSDAGVVGIAICKREPTELKLCTLWRDSATSGTDTSKRLVRASMDWLGTTRPLFTVPSDRIARLRPILNDIDVGKGVCIGSVYRPGVDEFVFNAPGMPR
ncbi:hypothetical protein G6L37_02110 [Agrobacterium rubi]|nr:hypothetical protein [Agrobacterium rubi]NTF24188.1 hypothetical protein [Agrobacterium rubi]